MSARPVAELQRAWAALQSGQFRAVEPPAPGTEEPSPSSGPSAGDADWDPGHPVLPVLGAHGSAGATTLALALATAAASPARVVEASAISTSGLVGCATAELGGVGAGWLRGLRDRVVIDRQGEVYPGPDQVPLPVPAPEQVSLTVLDPGWDANQLYLRGGWLARVAWPSHGPVVVVTTPDVPGLRRAEQLLSLLAEDTEPVLAVTRANPRRWGRTIRHCMGDRTRHLSAQHHLVGVPDDPALALRGLDTTDLPAALVAAATHVLELTGLETPTQHHQRGRHT